MGTGLGWLSSTRWIFSILITAWFFCALVSADDTDNNEIPILNSCEARLNGDLINAQVTQKAAEILLESAVKACPNPDLCEDDLDQALSAVAHGRFRRAFDKGRLTTQRGLLVISYVTGLFGPPFGTYFGLQSAAGTGGAIAASVAVGVITQAIVVPLGHPFMFRFSSWAQKLGHWVWGGQDIWGKDRARYDETQGFIRGQLINYRLGMGKSMETAANYIKQGRIDRAAAYVAEVARSAYRLFYGVNHHDATLLDVLDTALLGEVEIPQEPFLKALYENLDNYRRKDIDMSDPKVREYFAGLIKFWFTKNPKTGWNTNKNKTTSLPDNH